MYGFIYITTNHINGKKYIGQKNYDKNGRWKEYLGSGIILKQAIQKYGVDNFSKEIIEECETKELLNEREKYWISYYNAVKSNKFYNIANGGDGGNTISGYSKEQLDELEKYYIALCKTEKYGGVYNITTGGDDGYTFINSFVTKLKNINIIKNTKTICCLTLNKVFIDIDEITKFYKNENVFNIRPEDIIKCCNGQSEYSGKSVNGKPLKWKFI